MTTIKSIHNACPVCGKPRGKGRYEFAHGKCAEIRAATEGKKLFMPGDSKFGKLTVEQHEKHIDNRTRKKYLSGKLLPWMLT